MAKLSACWVPGYSTVAQSMGGPPLDWRSQDYTDINGLREGFGVAFYLQARRANWFHVPIPTPALIDDVWGTLRRVMVLYELPRGAALNSIHVWDGPNRILQRDSLCISGCHLSGLDADNTWAVNHGIRWGVGISMLISCVEDAKVVFASAGAEFCHDV